jgi:hypothetical protein
MQAETFPNTPIYPQGETCYYRGVMSLPESPGAVAVLPYGFAIKRSSEGLTSELTVLSDGAIRAAAALALVRGSDLVIAGESHPNIPLPGTSPLMEDVALELGVPNSRIVLLDSPESPPNNTRKQMAGYARYFLSGRGSDQEATFVGWKYHWRRFVHDARAKGLRGDHFTFIPVEEILEDDATGKLAGVTPEQRELARQLCADLAPSERLLHVAGMLGLGPVIDFATNRLGPRYLDIDPDGQIHRGYILREYRRLQGDQTQIRTPS